MVVYNLEDDIIGNWILNDQYTNRLDQWVDSDYQWEALTSGTLDYIHIRGMQAISWQEDGGYNTVCGNDNKIFLGSRTHGIQYMNKADLTVDSENPIDLSTYIQDYLIPPQITDFNIRYLYCNDNYLVALTPRGIDIIKYTHPGFISNRLYPANYQAYKCFVISTGHAYYTLSGTSNWRISKTKNPASFDYTTSLDILTGGSILAGDIKLTDLYITEGTSRDNISNTIFCATTSGAYIIEENTNDYYYFSGSLGDYSFTSIWADYNANIQQSRVYVSSATCLYVINMSSKEVYSRWKADSIGINGKPLSYEHWDGIKYTTTPITDNIVDVNKF